MVPVGIRSPGDDGSVVDFGNRADGDNGRTRRQLDRKGDRKGRMAALYDADLIIVRSIRRKAGYVGIVIRNVVPTSGSRIFGNPVLTRIRSALHGVGNRELSAHHVLRRKRNDIRTGSIEHERTAAGGNGIAREISKGYVVVVRRTVRQAGNRSAMGRTGSHRSGSYGRAAVRHRIHPERSGRRNVGIEGKVDGAASDGQHVVVRAGGGRRRRRSGNRETHLRRTGHYGRLVGAPDVVLVGLVR